MVATLTLVNKPIEWSRRRLWLYGVLLQLGRRRKPELPEQRVARLSRRSEDSPLWLDASNKFENSLPPPTRSRSFHFITAACSLVAKVIIIIRCNYDSETSHRGSKHRPIASNPGLNLYVEVKLNSTENRVQVLTNQIAEFTHTIIGPQTRCLTYIYSGSSELP